MMGRNKNLIRFLGVNLVGITRDVVADVPRSGPEIERIVSRWHARLIGADLDDAGTARLLFGRDGWNRIPRAVLEARHLPLPADMVPTTRDDLHSVLMRLLSRDGDTALPDDMARAFISGWSEGRLATDAVTTLVDELWLVRQSHDGFYRALVSGRHGTALELIASHGLPRTIKDHLAISLLVRMALVWSAFDCQAITALTRWSMKRPLGALIQGAGAKVGTATLVGLFRPAYLALEKIVAGYRYAADGDAAKPVPRLRSDVVTDIRSKAALSAASIEQRHGLFALDAAMAYVARQMRERPGPFWRALRGEEGTPVPNQPMSGTWFAGLTPVETIGLTAMRHVQLEQQIDELVRSAIEHARTSGMRPPISLPRLSPEALRSGWKTRARLLGDCLRQTILQDADSRSRWMARKPGTDGDYYRGHDDAFTDAVIAFLNDTNQVSSPTDNALAWEKRQALHHLDLRLEARFYN